MIPESAPLPPSELATSSDRSVAAPRRALTRSRGRARQITVGLVALMLTVLAAATLGASSFAVGVPEQLDEGEPLIYGLAGRVVERLPLYQPIDRQPFVQVHYTPVYYRVVAALREHVAAGFGPGRAVSLAAGLVAAILVGYLTASRLGSWWAAGLAVVMFLGLAFPGAPAPFIALERVDMLGAAISLAAVAVLALRTEPAHLIAAGALAGLALLTKQSLFAAGVAGAIWLATINPRKAGLFTLSAAITVLAPALRLEWTSAGALWDNIGPANPSPTALAYGAYLFQELLVLQGVPTLLAVLYVVSSKAWQDQRQRLLVAYWLISTISIAGMVKVGANHNYWIEFAAPNAVLATLGIWKCLHSERRPIVTVAAMLPILLLAVQLAVLTPARFFADRSVDLVPLSWSVSIGQFMRLASETDTFDQLVDHVRQEHGVILAESLDVAVLAGHPVRFEPFAFSMLEEEGRWSSQPLVDDICAGRIDLLVLSYPLENDIHPVGLREFPMWPNTVLTALRHAMRLDRIEANHWLYRPAIAGDTTLTALCEISAQSAR